MAKAADDDESLKRLGGGRWQTRDARFTIEPQSGTWVVVDGEQTDDLGLPLIRGPFGSLTAAKEAIATARASATPVKPLPRPTKARAASTDDTASRKGSRLKTLRVAGATAARRQDRHRRWPRTNHRPNRAGSPTCHPPLDDTLGPRSSDLTEVGAPDPEGMTRRDVSGGVPAIAAYAITRRIDELGRGRDPGRVVALLGDGRDDTLGVQWRVVDGEGRPILIPRTIEAEVVPGLRYSRQASTGTDLPLMLGWCSHFTSHSGRASRSARPTSGNASTKP